MQAPERRSESLHRAQRTALGMLPLRLTLPRRFRFKPTTCRKEAPQSRIGRPRVWGSHTNTTSLADLWHSPLDCFLTCWDRRFLIWIQLERMLLQQCALIFWACLRQMNMASSYPTSFTDCDRRRRGHDHVSCSMRLCIAIYSCFLFGYYFCSCLFFLPVVLPRSLPTLHPPSLLFIFNCLFVYFSPLVLLHILRPLILTTADIWQVLPGIVGDGRRQPCVLWTDGGSLPVWRGSQCCSDPSYLSARSRIPGLENTNPEMFVQ